MTSMRAVRGALAAVALAGAAVACRNGTGPDGEIRDGAVLRASALVEPGIEVCPVSLLIDGRRYEPVGLPAELRVVGLRLRVEGIVRDRPSVCMVRALELRSARRE